MTGLLLAALLLQAAPPQTQTETWNISGRVLSPDGNPAAKVAVGALVVGDPPAGPYSPFIVATDTDADGKYKLSKLPAGKYRVVAGILGQATYFPGVPEESNGNIVVLTGTADLDNINFALIRPATLEIAGRTITEIVKMFELRHPSQDAKTRIITALRSRFNARYIAQTSTAIMLRDTPARLSFDERLIQDFDKSAVGQAVETVAARQEPSSNPLLSGVGLDANGNPFLLEANALHDLNPTRAQLRTNGFVALDIKGDTRAIFEAIAEKADLNVAFDPRVETGKTVEFKVENLDARDVLDVFCKRTSTYWQALDDRSILVAPDTPAVRGVMDPQVYRTFYLTNGANVQLIEIITILRTLLNRRYLATAPAVMAISVRDTPAMMAVLEAMIRDMDKPVPQSPTPATPRAPLPPSDAMTLDASGNLIAVETGVRRNVTPNRADLQLKQTNPISLRMMKDARATFQALADLGGVTVQFDASFVSSQPLSFRVKDVTVLDAFDLLALQTGSFWQVIDSHSIRVVANTPATRESFIPKTQAAIYLTHTEEEKPLNDILAAVRTLLNARQVELDARNRALVLTDTPTVIALARKIVADLDRPGR